VALSAMSSGTTPASDMASEQCSAVVVDSATRVNAYPGDLQGGGILYMSKRKEKEKRDAELTFRFPLPYKRRSRGRYRECND
jgi:hypothetical protein